MSELQTYLETCEKAVRAAGATIRDWIGKTSVQRKGPADFVTEADFAAQEVVKTTVLRGFPHHSVLGEEDQLAGDTPSKTDIAGSSIRWTAQPISCTESPIMPYRWPWSIAARSLVGAVFDPSLNECFTAAVGQGAFLNGRPIRTSSTNQLSEVIAGTGFPANLQPDSPDLLVFNKALFRCQGVRAHRLGITQFVRCCRGTIRRVMGIFDQDLGYRRRRAVDPGGWRGRDFSGRREAESRVGAFSGLGEPGLASAIAGIGAGSRLTPPLVGFNSWTTRPMLYFFSGLN